MDLNPLVPQNQIDIEEKKFTPPPIRTMQGDIKKLSGNKPPTPDIPTPKRPNQTPTTTIAPPKKLPIHPSLPKPPTPPLSIKKPEEKNGKPKGRKNLKFVFISIIIIVVIGGITGFLYWWNYIHIINQPPINLTHYQCQNYQCIEVEGEGTDQCLISADCLPDEPTMPNSLIPTQETETIDILAEQLENKITQSLLLEKLKTSVSQDQLKGIIKRILIKLTANREAKYASLSDFSKMLGLQIPNEVMANFSDYTLFAYQPESNESEICQSAKILEPDCYGPRLGLVIQISNTDETKILVKKWEETMVNDLRPLILVETAKIEKIGFKDNTDSAYQEIDIRYQNLPISPITINYSFFNDLLLIGTSKESIYRAIDILAPAL